MILELNLAFVLVIAAAVAVAMMVVTAAKLEDELLIVVLVSVVVVVPVAAAVVLIVQALVIAKDLVVTADQVVIDVLGAAVVALLELIFRPFRVPHALEVDPEEILKELVEVTAAVLVLLVSTPA